MTILNPTSSFPSQPFPLAHPASFSPKGPSTISHVAFGPIKSKLFYSSRHKVTDTIQHTHHPSPWPWPKKTLLWHFTLGHAIPGTNDTQYRQEVVKILKEIAEVAGAKLHSGAKVLDIVQEVVMSLEGCPLFNAGKGSVLNEDGEHEVTSNPSCYPSSHNNC